MPIAVVIAVVAGLIPAWLAASAEPVASVRPPVLAIRRAHHPAGITGLAVANVLRTPGLAVVGAVSLASASRRCVLAAVDFPSACSRSLLGNAVRSSPRRHYIAVIATSRSASCPSPT